MPSPSRRPGVLPRPFPERSGPSGRVNSGLRDRPSAIRERQPNTTISNQGTTAAFLLIAVLAGAVLWRGRFPFPVRVALILLGLLGMLLALLDGMGLL